jgi:hypothetical protein
VSHDGFSRAQAALHFQYHRVAQAQLVAGIEGCEGHHTPSVDETAVRAAQVFDHVTRALQRQSGVLAADLGVFQNDVVARFSANGYDGLVQIESLAGSWALPRQKLPSTVCHQSLLFGARCWC